MGGDTGQGQEMIGEGPGQGRGRGRGRGKGEGQGRGRGPGPEKEGDLKTGGEGQDQMNTGEEGQDQGQGIGSVLIGVDQEIEKDPDDKNVNKNLCTNNVSIWVHYY